jgi:guanidinopropionase
MKLVTIASGQGSLGHCDDSGPDAIIDVLQRRFVQDKPVIDAIECPKSNLDAVNSNVQQYFSQNSRNFIAIGGDHSLTYSIMKGISKENKLGLVIFDAHADVMHNFSPPSHEDYLRVLIEEGIVDPDKIILIGIRNTHSIEDEYIKTKKLKVFSPERIEYEGLESFTDMITELIAQLGPFYLSLDIDVLDPSFAPATGYPEPAGLSTRELLYMLQRIKRNRNLVACDLVEVNGALDKDGKTALVAAKIVEKLL